MQRRYNLATPELISKLVAVGAVTDNAKSGDGTLQYRVRVPLKFVDDINPLLTGSKLRPFAQSKKQWCIFSKDVWNALRNDATRRTSYGHIETPRPKQQQTHCGLPINSFTFSDGKVIRLCGNQACTVFDAHRHSVLNGGN